MKASLKIILKKTELSDGTHPINLRITINRKSKFYKTPYNVLPKFWNESASEFTSKFPNFLQANRILYKIKQDASKILDLMVEEEFEFSLETFDSLKNPTIFFEENGILYLKEGADERIPLTNSLVFLSELFFYLNYFFYSILIY